MSALPDDETIYRAVATGSINEKTGEPTSATFLSGSDPNISVDRAALSSAEETLDRWPAEKYSGVVALTVKPVTDIPDVRDVVEAPTESNPAHSLIRPDPAIEEAEDRRWHGVRRRLARLSNWALRR